MQISPPRDQICTSWRPRRRVDVNPGIAHSVPFGREAGLRLVDEIAEGAALRDYAPLAARADACGDCKH